ncbi:MAG: prepilin-type N-terminal cleavage/methylation domain-containing protein [Rickettsiales bacterium]|nr:prepilin-type N-terminal cleavage/methylation domain-containing protein [Rickettsiales bacterium]
MKIKQKGFSVVELAVVVVIIGVLISMFFFASGILDTAKVNGIISEINYFKASQDRFREKYGFRPGDVPASFLSQNGFTGYSDDVCATTNFGNGKWDNATEEDLIWLQMSMQKFIRQSIYFDPCSAPAYRDVGTHRPASEAVNGVGWTFVNTDSVVISSGPTTRRFLYVLKVGQKNNSSDRTLSKGKIKVSIHMDIDTKIDAPFTPTSGKYFVGAECIDAAGAYLGEKSTNECVGGYAEIPSEVLENLYTP